MRFVGYVKPGGRDPQDRMMGVVIGDKVAPLASIDAFYDDLPRWRQHASEVKTGEISLSGLQLAPPVPRDAKIVCAAINYVKHGVESKLPTPTKRPPRRVFSDIRSPTMSAVARRSFSQ